MEEDEKAKKGRVSRLFRGSQEEEQLRIHESAFRQG